MPNLQELVDAFRSDIDEATASYYSDAEIVRWINRGKGFLWQKALEADEDYGLTSFTFSVVANTATYDIQSNVHRIRRVEQIFPNDSTRTPVPWYPISLNEKGDYGVSAATATSDLSLRYVLEARQLHFYPTPNSALAGTNNARVWYIPRLGDLHSGTATAGTSSTITFPSATTLPSTATNVYRIDNYYVGLDILITGGTGIGQIRRISGYVGSTRVATVDVDWTTNPDSTSTYSLITPFPEEFQYLQSLYAVTRGYAKDEADSSQMKEEFNELLAQFILSIEGRQNQEPRYVHYETDERFVG